MATDPGTAVAATLAAFSVRTESAAIPPSLRASGVRHLLDVVGCGLAGIGCDVADQATAVMVAQGGAPEASVFGQELRLPAASAAFANGTHCHALDFDDTHEAGICHASAVVWPAALAVGESRRRPGAELLEAYLVGCEVALRIAVATADGLYARGFHPTSVCGAFGAAAASARLLRLDEPTTTSALGIVGSFAAGLLEYLSDGSPTKPLHAGSAARAGLDAALLAQAGARGPARVIEGRFGLQASHTGASRGSETICDGLGRRWEAAELAIKPFPACHFAHASTWLASELAREHGIDPSEIREIVVRIPPEGLPLVLDPLEEKVAPKSAYDAKFSLPYTVAYHLIHGDLPLTAFEPHRLRDPAILRLAAKVRYEAIREADGPHSRFAGGTRIVTASGHEHERFLADPPGSPRNPLDERAVEEKFRANAGGALSAAEVDAASEALLNLAAAPTVDALADLLRGARQPAARVA